MVTKYVVNYFDDCAGNETDARHFRSQVWEGTMLPDLTKTFDTLEAARADVNHDDLAEIVADTLVDGEVIDSQFIEYSSALVAFKESLKS